MKHVSVCDTYRPEGSLNWTVIFLMFPHILLRTNISLPLDTLESMMFPSWTCSLEGMGGWDGFPKSFQHRIQGMKLSQVQIKALEAA